MDSHRSVDALALDQGFPTSDATNRCAQRYSVKASVVRYDGGPGQWTSLDLSTAGAFLVGEPTLQPGEEMDLGLWLPALTESTEIVTRAQVRWVNSQDHPAKPSSPIGMGVAFVGLGDDERRTLRSYLTLEDSDVCLDELVIETEPFGGLPPRISVGDSSGYGTPPPPQREDAPPVADAPPIKELGPYRIVRSLRSGGMARVFVAEHMQLGRRVALKVLNPAYIRDEQTVRRFFDEARVVNQIHHPNIIEITDFMTTRGQYCYVMELLDGESLAQVLQKEGPLPLDRCLNIAAQLSGALAAAHRVGVIHRDLKPGNVMLIQRERVGDFVKLLDFGIAKFLEPLAGIKLGQTSSGFAVGTPGYMAPEQILAEEVDERSDVYALGVLLYEMVTGRRCFRGTSWGEIAVKQTQQGPPPFSTKERRRLPRSLRRLVLDCLARDRGDRPQSVSAVSQRLLQIQAESNTAFATSDPETGNRLSWSPARSGAFPFRLAATGLALLLAVAAAAAALMLTRGKQGAEPVRATANQQVAVGAKKHRQGVLTPPTPAQPTQQPPTQEPDRATPSQPAAVRTLGTGTVKGRSERARLAPPNSSRRAARRNRPSGRGRQTQQPSVFERSAPDKESEDGGSFFDLFEED